MPRPVNADAAATKQRILDSALFLFAEKGIDGVSLRELAADAKVSSAMIHHCFGGKDGLRQAAIDTMYSQLGKLALEMSQLLHEKGASPAQIFDRAVRVAFAFGRENRSSVRLLHRDVIANGELDSRREAAINAPFMASVTAALSEILDVSARDLRWPLHSSIALVTRYAASSDAELIRVTQSSSIEEAVAMVEKNLQHTVRVLMRIPSN